ncbi:MAG TPA: hypothetical protein VMT03_11110 [Polyangia bacterium]|nr:hypothetical protein [Polyangia bacterium]
MAGKTFPGIGDEDESSPVDPADASDSGATPAPGSPYYSGPTVVDDAKVEEGLLKLRSLDAPSDLLPGEVDSALDIVESGGHQMPGWSSVVTKDGGRGTMIGHSVVPPTPVVPPAQEKPFDDRMRGTLYGHMLHLPDQLVQPAPEEPSTRELTIVDRSAPTSHAVEVYQPEAVRRAAAGIPQAEAFPVSNRYRSIPIDLDAGSRRKTVLRVLAAGAAIAAIVGAALIWLHMNNDEPDQPTRPAAVAQPVQPAPPPVAPPAAPAPAAPPAAVVVEPMAAPTAPSAVQPVPAVTRPAPERARTTATLRPATPPSATPARTERHHPAPGEGPAKPRPSKHQVEEDPDGTLAPTIQ